MKQPSEPIDTLKAHLSRAGKAGKGDSKRRGDSEYYKNLRAKAKNKSAQAAN